jgi:protoporphyrinogen oxidase
MKKIAIIGSGPAGITAAYELSKEIGKSISTIDVYESTAQIGGMSASNEFWNQWVDLGPHRFFSYDEKVNNLWMEIAGDNHSPVTRLTRIFYGGKLYHYPLKAFNALFTLGFFKSMGALFSYFRQQIFPVKDVSTFEGWVTRRFGRKLYEIFFKTYSEKLWGISCNELDADFASQRIKKLSLGAAVWNSLFPGKNKHKTLAEEFLYPLQGTGWIYEEMARRAQEMGARIHLNTPVSKVLKEDGKVTGIITENGVTEKFDAVISTMPVSLLLEGLNDVPPEILDLSSKLRFRNTILVYININGQNLFPDQWMYIHSKELQTGRITNFRNWVPELYGEEKSSIIALEYWCFDEDKLWNQSDEELITLATEEIQKTGLIGHAAILDGKVVRLHRSYPVYFKNYRNILEPIENYLKTIENLYPIGRYGAYKYNNQDHSILMGVLAAENISGKASHNLWTINTDYDNYQEGKSK